MNMLETLSANKKESSEFLKPFTSSLISLAKPSKHECVVCASPALYKCPKCSTRTCSAKCSKTHKEDQKCDGQSSSTHSIKQSWQPIFSASQFQESKNSIEDQQFLHKLGNAIRANIGGDEKETAKQNDEMQKTKTISTPKLIAHNGMHRLRQLSQPERFLLQNAQFRRIWLRLDEPKNYSPNNSHHEPFSDTIFWTCTVKFVCRSQQTNKLTINNESKDEKAASLAIQFPLVDYGMNDDDEEEEGREIKEDEAKNGLKMTYDNVEKSTKEIGELEEGEDEEGEEEDGELEMEEEHQSNQQKQSELKWLNYTVHNIPESIRLVTLLRQFLRPKPHGSVISRSELDLSQLDPFIRAFESFKPDDVLNLAKNDLDKLTIYLEVQLEADAECGDVREMRYYPMDSERTILENLRNRFVIDHPNFVVLLRRADEFGEVELPMMGEEEQKLLQAEREQQIDGGNGNESGNGFKDRPKWQQKRGEEGDRQNHRRRGGACKKGGGGRKMMNGPFQQQQSMMPSPHMQIHPPPNGNPPPYFYHPYVLNPSPNPNPYQVPNPQQYAHGQPQQFACGNGWQQPNRSWLPRNKSWRGGRN